MQKNFVVLNSSVSSSFTFCIALASVGVKSLAVWPQIQPVAMSAIFDAGTRQSIFSFKVVEIRSSLILSPCVVCFTLPKISFCSHSSVSLHLADPAKTLPRMGMISHLKTYNRGKSGRQMITRNFASHLNTIGYGCLQNGLELKDR